MKVGTRLLYLLCFVGLAAGAALALDRVVSPSISGLLLRAVIAASIAAAPGLVWRRAWPLSVVLLPLAAYLLIRTTIPAPVGVEGLSGQYHFYVQALGKGFSAYVTQFFPLSVTDQPELRLTLAFVVFWIVGAAGFIGLGLRRTVPAIIILVVLIGFCFTVDTSARAVWTAMLFFVLAACLLVLSRGLRRQNWRLRDAAAGGIVGVVAAGLALTLMLAAPSAVAQPWQDWRSWDPFRQGGSVYSFNWLQNYPKLLNPANNVTIMRVDSPTPSYWRANALDSFTGNAWVSSQSFPLRPEVAEDAGAFTYSITPFEPTPKGKTVKEIFNLSSVYTNYIFVGGEPRELTMTQQILLRTNDMRALHVSRAIGPNVEYAATAVVPNLKPADLVGKGDDYPNGLDRYLELPFPAKSALIAYEDDALSAVVAPDSIEESAWRLMMADQNPEWLELYSLDQQIVGDATDPYDKTLRIELYLRKFFDYSLTPPASTYSSPYAAFLFDTRTGYCQHFSGAMSLLLRFNGIPARVAVGFTTGELERGAYTVATNNAHAWVEVYFPQVGWVAFDPTPGRNIPTAGPSSTSPGFINPFADSSAGGETTPTQPPREQLPEESGPEPGSTEDEGSFWSGISWLPWLVGILVLATVWPVGRSLWRSRDLRRGSTEHRLEASLRLLRTGLAEYGAPAGLALTTEETLRVIQVHLGIEVDSRFAERTDAVLFGSVRAVCEDLDGAEELRRQVNARLRKRHGWARTGLAWYGVPRRTPANGSAA